MNAAVRLMVTLGVAFCILMLLQCDAAPAPGDVIKRSLTSFGDVRRRQTAVCDVVNFPPPNQHIFCCKLEEDCECPRRMGVCAPSSSTSWSLLKRIMSL